MLGLFALLAIVFVAYLIMVVTYYVLEKNDKREQARLEQASQDQRFAAEAKDILQKSNTMTIKPLSWWNNQKQGEDDKTVTEMALVQATNNTSIQLDFDQPLDRDRDGML